MAAFSKHSAGLTFQCAVALTPLANTLVIVGEFLNCSVDAGFVLALPLHHGDLELDSVGVAILVAWPWLGRPICEIKVPVQEKCREGLVREEGVYVGQYILRCIATYITCCFHSNVV